MTVDLFTDLLLASLIVALSPIILIAVTLILSTPRGRMNGLTFSGGWLLGLLLITVVLTLITEGAEQEVEAGPTLLDAVKTGAGVLLLALAARKWIKRPQAGAQPEQPRWMQSVAGIAPRGAFILGFTLAAVNPKNLAFAAVAAVAIARSGVSGAAEALAVVVFVLLCSWTVLGALLAVVAAPARAATALGRVRAFMERHNKLIMTALYLIFGVKLLINGLTGLMG